jgi:hypothetical protein
MAGPDVFDQLLAAKWRDVEFPVTRMRMSIAHDLVEHKYWGVDGARVESVGLAPTRFSFSAPLLNGIKPGKNERWGALYPNDMRRLHLSFQKKERGELQHPEFGIIICKAERFEMDWDAARRGGVDAELSFVETLTEADAEILEDTQIKEVDIGDLDTAGLKADLAALLKNKGLPLPPYLENPKTSLTDLVNAVSKVVSYPGLVSYRSAGRINALLYQAERAKQAADLARSPLTWPITQEVERLKAVAHDLRQNLLARNKPIAFFTVPAPTTLAGLIRQLPQAKVTDLIKLNPSLMRGPEIDTNTVVRYYAAA